MTKLSFRGVQKVEYWRDALEVTKLYIRNVGPNRREEISITRIYRNFSPASMERLVRLLDKYVAEGTAQRKIFKPGIWKVTP